jgi:hypothetical protein
VIAMTETTQTTGPAADGRDEPEAVAARAQRQDRIAKEVQDCLGIDRVSSQEGMNGRRLAVATALADIAPTDEVEGMLTTHLLSTHAMAMDCVRSASEGPRDDRLRLSYMALAGRLLSIYARHVDRLERHRDWSEARAREAEMLRRQAIDPAEAARVQADNEEILDALLREMGVEDDGEEAFGEDEEIAEESGPANGPGPGQAAA